MATVILIRQNMLRLDFDQFKVKRYICEPDQIMYLNLPYCPIQLSIE